MATSTAVLISEPKRRLGVRTVRVRLSPDGYEARARIVDRPGDWFPYKRGDQVRVQILAGNPAAGVHITGLYRATSPRSSSNREIHARDGDLRLYAPNGDVRAEGDVVRLGEGDDSDQEAVAMITQLRADLLSLQQQFDTLVAQLNVATAAGLPLLTAVLPVVPLPSGLWTTAVVAGAVPVYTAIPIDPTHEKAKGAAGAVNVVAKPEEVI